MTNHSSHGGCLDADTALSLAQLLGEDPRRALDHVAACPACRGRLERWDEVARALSLPAREGFSGEVMAALPEPPAVGPAWGWRLVNAGLVFVGAGLLLVVLRAVASPTTLLAASGVAALVGLAIAPKVALERV